MSNFIGPTGLDEVTEAHQIRSRLAALHEMERHLVQTLEAMQKLLSSRLCIEPPYHP